MTYLFSHGGGEVAEESVAARTQDLPSLACSNNGERNPVSLLLISYPIRWAYVPGLLGLAQN